MYVVAGASGNTGSVVADKLLSMGQKVRALGRNAEHLKPLTMKGAEPFALDLTDAAALTRALTGARAVYIMIPPDMTSHDAYAFQKSVTSSFSSALTDSHVEYAVSLSSIGADKPENTGPVVGLHNLEQRLNHIPGLNVMHLRAGYFMENTLGQVGIIRANGFAGGPLRPDLLLPMIASRDIGAYAAERLLALDFRKQEVRELQGQRDLTMSEAAKIIGSAIGKPDLQYRQLPDEQIFTAMTQMGMSADVASLLLEMSAALNSGHMRALEPRTALNTTPTSFEKFVEEEFVPAYNSHPAAA